MRKLFNQKIDNDLTLSTEMIGVQKNDWVVSAIKEEYAFIISNFKTMDKNKDLKYIVKNKNIKEAIDNIDRIIHKRFGFKIKHVATPGVGYAVYPSPPAVDSALSPSEEILETYGNSTTGSMTAEEKTKVEHMGDFDMNTYNKVINSFVDNIARADDTAKTTGIHINLKTAYVSNMPEDYVVHVLHDMWWLFSIGITESEFVAILLHEIGHAFTYINYTYKVTQNTIVLMDNIRESGKNNASYQDTLIISYREAFGKEPPKTVKDGNAVTATIGYLEEASAGLQELMDNMHGVTDSEMLADQFAGRFGIGADLATGLTKLYALPEYALANTFMSLFMTFIQAFMSSILSGLGILASIYFGAMAAIFMFVVSQLFMLTLSIITNGGLSVGTTYDDNKRRLKRIKLEMIRQLRTIDFDKEFAAKVVRSIESLELYIEQASDTTYTSFIDRMVIKFKPGAKRLSDMKEIEQLTEDIMENTLHVSVTKLKLIGA